MSRTSIVSTGRPQTTDLRALDPSVSPLDAFELDTSNSDAPLLKMTNGWTIDKANTATTAATANNALALDASYIPSLTECIDPDPIADSVIIYDASAGENKKLKQGFNSAPPIGFVYWQLPGKSAPGDMYPGTTWDNVSDEFAGDFFRAEGGRALAFASGRQSDAIRNITGSFPMVAPGGYQNYMSGAFINSGYGGPSTGNGAYGVTFDASRVVPTAPENRSVNRTIRLWERIA